MSHQGATIRNWRSPRVLSQSITLQSSTPPPRATSEGVNGCFFLPLFLNHSLSNFALKGCLHLLFKSAKLLGRDCVRFTEAGVGDGDGHGGVGKEYAGQRVEYQRASSLYLFWKDLNKNGICKLQVLTSPQFLSCLARNHSSLCVLSPPKA